MSTEIKRGREQLTVTEVSDIIVTAIADGEGGKKVRAIRIYGSEGGAIPALEVLVEGASADKITIAIPESEF